MRSPPAIVSPLSEGTDALPTHGTTDVVGRAHAYASTRRCCLPPSDSHIVASPEGAKPTPSLQEESRPRLHRQPLPAVGYLPRMASPGGGHAYASTPRESHSRASTGTICCRRVHLACDISLWAACSRLHFRTRPYPRALTGNNYLPPRVSSLLYLQEGHAHDSTGNCSLPPRASCLFHHDGPCPRRHSQPLPATARLSFVASP